MVKKQSHAKTPAKSINTKRRSQLEYFGKAAAVIAGMSVLPSLTSGAMSFKKGAGGASTLWLADNGNVGIGTPNPATKLDVAGTITATAFAGNATSASSSPLLSGLGVYVWTAATLPNSYADGIQCSFVQGSNGWPNYGSVMNMRTYSGGGGSLQFFIPYSPTYGGTSPQVRFGNYDVSSGNSWTTWKTLWHSENLIPATTATANTVVLRDASANIYGNKVYGAVWNDIADYLEVDHEIEIEFGKVYVRDDNGQTRLSKKRCERGVIGIASDTYGMSVGKKGKTKKEIPIALAGIVLAHVDKLYASGTALVSAKNGRLTRASFWDMLFRSNRIVANYYKPEPAKKWNGVVVNNRHWVKIQ